MFGKKKNELPLHTILRLSKELGAERISKEATQLLAEYLTRELENLIRDAVKFAKHAERKTVMRDDVKLAIEKRK
jgi:histone H3/H4